MQADVARCSVSKGPTVTDLTRKSLGMALGRRISVKHKKGSQMVWL